MKILLDFLPWILFAYIAHHNFQLAAEVALLSSLLMAIPQISSKNIKILTIGTLIYFLGLIIISLFPNMGSIEHYSAPASTGTLFVIALVSIIIRKPFTIQYAKETVEEKYWQSELFLKINYHITFAWTLGFALMSIISAIDLIIEPQKNFYLHYAGTIISLGLIYFSKCYPDFASERFLKKES